MHKRILGRRYKIKFVPFLGKGVMGKCDNPSSPNPVIRIKKGLSETETLYTIIHEFLHGGDWSKDEEWIIEAAEDLTSILEELGYRKEKNLDGKKT